MGFTGDAGGHTHTRADTQPRQQHTPLPRTPALHGDRTARVRVLCVRTHLRPIHASLRPHAKVETCARTTAHACAPVWGPLYAMHMHVRAAGALHGPGAKRRTERGAGDSWVPTPPLHTHVPQEHTGHTRVPA